MASEGTTAAVVSLRPTSQCLKMPGWFGTGTDIALETGSSSLLFLTTTAFLMA